MNFSYRFQHHPKMIFFKAFVIGSGILILTPSLSAGQTQIRLPHRSSGNEPVPAIERSGIQLEITKRPSPPAVRVDVMQRAENSRKKINLAFKEEHMTAERVAKISQSGAIPTLKGVGVATHEVKNYLQLFHNRTMELKDIDGLLIIWSAAVEFDPSSEIGGANIDFFTPQLIKKIESRITALTEARKSAKKSQVTEKEKKGVDSITLKQLDALDTAMAEIEQEFSGAGNDPTAK